MQEKGIINTNQFIWMLFIIITSVPNLLAPGLLIIIAGRDAWLSVIGGWILDVHLAIVYAYMGIRFSGQNFVQYSITILGKYLGRIVGIMFPLFFLLVCTLLMSGFGEMMKNMFLPKTPIEVILISGFLLVGFGARKGIEVNGRTAEVLGPIYLLSMIVFSLLIIPKVNINLLKPQFDQGVFHFLPGAPFILTFYGICIMMAMFIPLCNRPENGFLAKFTAVSMGAYMVGSMVVLSTAVFGFEQVRNMAHPALLVSRMVNIGQFVERIEVFWMVILVGSAILASTITIWAFSLGISQIVGLKTYKPLVYPGILISFAISMTSFGDFLELTDFIHYTYPVFAAFVEAGLEIFLFILALVLNKRGNRDKKISP